ncbi:hypothetical protein NHX12_028682, partial [Muraenolepis orangiensis]
VKEAVDRLEEKLSHLLVEMRFSEKTQKVLAIIRWRFCSTEWTMLSRACVSFSSSRRLQTSSSDSCWILGGMSTQMHAGPPEYPGSVCVWALRLLPALCGALCVPLAYLLQVELGGLQYAALGAALLVLMENSLIVQSRFMLLESVLISFQLLSFCYWRFHNTPNRGSRYLWLIVAAVSCAGAVEVKYVGVSTYLLLLGIASVHTWQLIGQQAVSHWDVSVAGWASPGLLAQRDQIQQEIEELQTALVSQNADDLIGDNSSDSEESDGELGIAEAEEGCLQVNLVYQQVLLDLLDHVEKLLHQNAREQPAKKYLGRFLKPYFKDKLTGLGPPANMETTDRINNMYIPLHGKRLQIKQWEGWQKTLLINSVYKDCLKRRIQPKQSMIDDLSQKICSAGAEDKQALREQIALLEKDIELLRSQKEEELVGDRYDEHDWKQISNIDFEGTREAGDLRCFWRTFLHPSVNKSSWTPKEIEHLKKLSEEHGERDWESVAEKLGTDRTAFMCLQTYQQHVSKTLKKSSWSAEEDAQLRELVEEMRIGNFIPYTQMSYFMEGRDPSQLMYRCAHVLQPNLRKGPWSKDEDQALRQAVARLGEGHWCKIRLEVPGRSDGACRDRYIDCLKTEMKKGAFDGQERDLLVQLVHKHGVGNWSRIAAEIPNRFDAQCLREWRNYQVVERPSFGPLQQRELVVRSTLADASGRLLDTLTCAGPRLLRRGSRHRPLAVLQVSVSELHSFLMARSARAHRGRDARGRRPSRADDVSTGYLLMAAVAPWIGNLLVPDPTWDLEKGALALRRSAEAVSLSSTPVFRLLLQVLNDLLQQRHKWAQGQEQLKFQLIRPELMQVLPPQPLLLRTNARPPPSMYPVTRPVVPPQMAPLRLPHPTLFVSPPPAHVNTAGSHGAASLPCRPLPSPSLPSSAAVLQPADPADVVRGVKRERAKETWPSSGTPANQSRGAGESLDPPVKRMRRITAEAKALEEAVQAKCFPPTAPLHQFRSLLPSNYLLSLLPSNHLLSLLPSNYLLSLLPSNYILSLLPSNYLLSLLPSNYLLSLLPSNYLLSLLPSNYLLSLLPSNHLLSLSANPLLSLLSANHLLSLLPSNHLLSPL